VARGTATLIKKDIFKNLMWYVLPDSNKQYPLTLERVRKIRSLNNQNIIPEELEAVDVTTNKQKEVEPEFVDVVGHITLKSLEKADKKRQQGRRDQRGPQGGGGQKQLQKPPQQGQKPGGQQQRPQGQQQRPPGQQQQRPQQQRPQGQQPRPPGQQQKPSGQQPPRPQNQQQPPKPGQQRGNQPRNPQQRKGPGSDQKKD
jgi:hypothetical protein